ncbi:BTB domain-containing protein [Pleurotus pulmonarius]
MLYSVQLADHNPVVYSAPPRPELPPLPELLAPPPISTEPIHNSKYYLDSITFRVENELFKVPIRCVSFKTEPFRTLAARSLPQGDGPVEGMSDENPIVLPDTSKVDFERLLDVICVLDVKSHPITSAEVWLSALMLATKWRLLNVRKVAIETLDRMKLPPAQLVQYGRECKVAEWLVKGYYTFSNQEQSLSRSDAQDISRGLSIDDGFDDVLKLAGLRERAAQYRSNMDKMGMIRTTILKAEVDEYTTFEKYFYLEM